MDNAQHAGGGCCDARLMAADPDSPLSRADALAAGLTDGDLRRCYRRVLRGQWIRGGRPATRDDLRRAALRLAGPGAFLSHDSSAELYGGIVPPTDALHLGIRDDRRIRTPGLVVHRYRAPVETTVVQGFPATILGQTFVDLATRWPLVDLVVFSDSIALHRPAALDELRQFASTAKGRDVRKARRAASLTAVGAESPYETRTRLLMKLAGLPDPVVQHPIVDRAGREIYRLDLAYPAYRLAVEYDGDHHNLARQRAKDLARREDIEHGGWKFVVGVKSDILQHPGRFLRRIMTAMAAAGMPRPHLSEEWLLHFPS